MRFTTRFLALLFALAAACGDADQSDAGSDAGSTAADAQIADAEAPMCIAAENEPCTPCFERIGECCYDGDRTVQGMIEALVATCESKADCRVCCDECAAKNCDQIRAGHDCPPG